MRIRAQRLVLAAIAMMALGVGVGVGVGGAGAATLFTSTSHTTHVAVGATARLKSTTTRLTGPAPSTTTLTSCTGSTLLLNTGPVLDFVVERNSGGEVVGTVTGGAFDDCSPSPVALTFTTPWRLTVSGAPTVSGESTEYAATLSNMKFDFGSAAFSRPTTAVKVSETMTGLHRLCLDLDRAGVFTNFLTNIYVDGKFCFDLGSFNWSLTS